MAKSVEQEIIQLLAAAKGGIPEVEGAKEFKVLKDRNVSIFLCSHVCYADVDAFAEVVD